LFRVSWEQTDTDTISDTMGSGSLSWFAQLQDGPRLFIYFFQTTSGPVPPHLSNSRCQMGPAESDGISVATAKAIATP
jgi:hypothetical protein